jgi:hypothetical protein
MFDRSGHVVAWLDPPEFLLALDGAVIGWLHDGAVLDLSGQQAGYFAHGQFRDPDGAIVAWMKGSSGPSPKKPITSVRPKKPIRRERPGRPARRGVIVTSPPVPVWSLLSIDDFLPDDSEP